MSTPPFWAKNWGVDPSKKTPKLTPPFWVRIRGVKIWKRLADFARAIPLWSTMLGKGWWLELSGGHVGLLRNWTLSMIVAWMYLPLEGLRTCLRIINFNWCVPSMPYIFEMFRMCSIQYWNSDLKLIRTHLVSILRGSKEGFVNWQGIQCSTWVSISRPTTLRSFFAPLGNRELQCVENGNCMAARLALVCLLVMALSGRFVVEQPGSSLLWRHPRLQWLCCLIRATCSCK